MEAGGEPGMPPGASPPSPSCLDGLQPWRVQWALALMVPLEDYRTRSTVKTVLDWGVRPLIVMVLSPTWTSTVSM